MITSKETASQLAAASERFVEELSRALVAEQSRASAGEFERLKRAVGLIIGKMETELLAPLYRQYPELEPEFDEDAPDGPMTPEEEAVAASLSPEMVARIDAALLSHARTRERKVAMLVGLTMGDPSVRVPGLPDLFYAQRVKILVERGALIAEGNLDYMRYSEVRLPEKS